MPLYILQLGGSVKEVALAAFLGGIAATIGSMVWGKLIDMMHLRMAVIAVSSASVAACAAAIYFASDLTVLMLASAFIGFLTAGSGPVTNLLVMERSKKEEWVGMNSWTYLVTCAGIAIAMVAGYVWLTYYDVQSYAAACAVIAVAAGALGFVFTKDSHKRITAPRRMAMPQIRFRRGMSKKELLFFAAIGLYYVSGNLFFTPYTPFLKENGISDAQVFLAYTVLHLSKVVFLPFNGRLVRMIGEKLGAKSSYIPRLSGIASMAAVAFVLSGNPGAILAITLAAFVAVDIAFSIWNTTTTSILMKGIPAGREGNVLGAGSTATGLGLLAGSMAAGELTAALGYGATFALAAAALAASFLMLKAFFQKAAVEPMPAT
jgi:MFS family permease